MESIQISDIETKDKKCSNDIKHENDLGNNNNSVQIRMTLMIYKKCHLKNVMKNKCEKKGRIK